MLRPKVLGACLLALAIASFYAWLPPSYPAQAATRAPGSPYGELTEALLHGQTHLQRQPAPELLALADPYDPAQNARWRVNDLSLFAGRYYIYHGIGPVVAVLLPFRLLTGMHLSEVKAVWLFGSGTALLGLLLLAHVRRRFVPTAPAGLVAAGAVALVFANSYHAVLRQALFNHLPIAAAAFFLGLALWAAARALAARTPLPWLAWSGVAAGLAVGSRPHYLVAGALLLLPAVAVARRPGVRPAAALAAFALPLGAIVAALLAYNLARFSNPLEFGQHYMLGAWDQRKLVALQAAPVWINAWHYLFFPGNLSLEFPHVTAPGWEAVGLLVSAPFVWLALPGAAVLLRPGPGARDGELRLLLGLVGAAGAANLVLLLLLPSGNAEAVTTSANARYAFDFAPLAALFSALGALVIGHRLAGMVRGRRLWTGAAGVLAGLSVLGGLSLDLQHFPAESYASLARVLNLPGQLLRPWREVAVYGPVQLDLVFPATPANRYEPLVAVGDETHGDLVYVFYDSPTTVRFGLVGTAMRGPLSPPIPVDYAKEHRLKLQLGALYPAAGRSAGVALTEGEAAELRRTLRIELDGQTVYHIPARFYATGPQSVHVGSTPILLGYSAAAFSGRIVASSRLPVVPPEPTPDRGAPQYGPVRLTLRFPADKPGVAEPLVVSGLPGAGDFVYVRYEDDRHLIIGLDHWGAMGLRSERLLVDYSVNHTLQVEMGALLPAPGHVFFGDRGSTQVDALKRRVRVVLDREVVLEGDLPTYESSPYDVFIGRNIIGGSTCTYEFTGEIKSSRRLPLTP